jgi:hypothetical protein
MDPNYHDNEESMNLEIMTPEQLKEIINSQRQGLRQKDQQLQEKSQQLQEQNRQLFFMNHITGKSLQNRQDISCLLKSLKFPTNVFNNTYLGHRGDQSHEPNALSSVHNQKSSGNCQLSEFRRRELVEDKMVVKRIETDIKFRLKSFIAEKLFRNQPTDFETFMKEEVEVLGVFWDALYFHRENLKSSELDTIQPFFILFVDGLIKHYLDYASSTDGSSRSLRSMAANNYPKLQGNIEGSAKSYLGYTDVLLLEDNSQFAAAATASSSEKFDFDQIRLCVELKTVMGDLSRTRCEQAKDQHLGEMELIRQKRSANYPKRVLIGGLSDIIAYSLVVGLIFE